MTRNGYKHGLFEVHDMLCKAQNRLYQLRDDLEEDECYSFPIAQRVCLFNSAFNIVLAKQRIEQAQRNMKEKYE